MKDSKNTLPHESYQIILIGYVTREQSSVYIKVLPSYCLGLKELENFSHIQIIWWISDFDDDESRTTVTFNKMPFDAPELGVFACRSPMRPNPIGLTTAKILKIDQGQGLIEVADIDAYDGTPVIDLKAYLPFCDRVQNVKVADWAAHWPAWLPEEGLSLEE